MSVTLQSTIVNPAAAPTQSTGNPLIDNPASWVIRDKTTKVAVMETYQRSVVDKINTEKYEAVPAVVHLGELNRSIRASAAAGAVPAAKPATVRKLRMG